MGRAWSRHETARREDQLDFAFSTIKYPTRTNRAEPNEVSCKQATSDSRTTGRRESSHPKPICRDPQLFNHVVHFSWPISNYPLSLLPTLQGKLYYLSVLFLSNQVSPDFLFFFFREKHENQENRKHFHSLEM